MKVGERATATGLRGWSALRAMMAAIEKSVARPLPSATIAPDHATSINTVPQYTSTIPHSEHIAATERASSSKAGRGLTRALAAARGRGGAGDGPAPFHITYARHPSTLTPLITISHYYLICIPYHLPCHNSSFAFHSSSNYLHVNVTHVYFLTKLYISKI